MAVLVELLSLPVIGEGDLVVVRDGLHSFI